jgi:mannitol/fructose-specific phosphotransferase system IIA component (Ntr-type)
MKVSKYLLPEQIHLDVALPDKVAVLRFVAEAFEGAKVAGNAEKVFQALTKREALMSTGIGGGIGIPHALTAEVEDLSITLVRLRPGIPFQAIDNRPVDIVIGLAVPENETTLHLRALAGISGLCKKPGMLQHIRTALDAEALWKAMRQAEESVEET